MARPSLPIDNYIGVYARQDDPLGRLLRNPDPESGIVHTPREIAQQPLLWRHTAQLIADQADALHRFLREAGLYGGGRSPALILTGAGTSHYVGMSLSDLLRERFGTFVSHWPTTRLAADPKAPFVDDRDYLMVHFARSGDSPESKAVIEFALEHHAETARHVIITCNGEGELARIARAHPERAYPIVLHEACNDQGLAMTSSYSAMVTAGQALARLGDMERFEAQVDRVAQAGEHVLHAYADTIYELADPDIGRAFYLGNADLLGAATESALKVQELTAGDVVAKGEDTMAFRHGPISAVNGRTLICFFLSANPHTRRYELDVLEQYQEIFAEMGARTAVVSAGPPETSQARGVASITYDPEARWQVPAHYQVAPAVLVGQLYGLFAACRRHRNVDEPSVDKALYSRTVQGVTLHAYGNGHSSS